MNIFKKIDIAGKFSIGLIISMSITFILSGIVVLKQQSAALNDLLSSSNVTTHAMFNKNSENAKSELLNKVKNLSLLLAAISPDAIADSEISTIYSYAKQVKNDRDISYVAYFDSDGKLINIAGEKSLIKQGPYVTQKIIADEFQLGEVVIGYTYDQLNIKLAAAKALNKTNIDNMNSARDSALQISTISLGIAMLLCGIIIVITLLWMFRIMIVNRLKILEHNMRDIAEGDGDLTHRITVNGQDGIDRLGNYFNLFLIKIHQAIT